MLQSNYSTNVIGNSSNEEAQGPWLISNPLKAEGG